MVSGNRIVGLGLLRSIVLRLSNELDKVNLLPSSLLGRWQSGVRLWVTPFWYRVAIWTVVVLRSGSLVLSVLGFSRILV